MHNSSSSWLASKGAVWFSWRFGTKPLFGAVMTQFKPRWVNVCGIHRCKNVYCGNPFLLSWHGPFTRYAKLLVVHAPGMPETFSPPPTSKKTACWWSQHASRHVRDARAVMHVGIANQWWRGKRSQHSRRMRNPQFVVSGKRPIQTK